MSVYVDMMGVPQEAPLDTLLSMLISEDGPSSVFVDIFLLNIHTLAAPIELVEYFSAHFSSSPSASTDHLLNFMNRWLEQHWLEDFHEQSQLIEAVHRLLHSLPASNAQVVKVKALLAQRTASDSFKAEDERKKQESGGKSEGVAAFVQGVRKLVPEAPPKPELLPASSSRAVSALNFSPLELARQLTLIDSHIYRQIRPRESMGQAWAKSAAKRRAAHLLQAIDRFNKTSEWVATEILRNDGYRLSTLCHIIEVAHHLLQMNNFQSLMAIVGGLGASSISRLKSLWEALPSKHQEMMDAVHVQMALTSNMKPLRLRLAQCAEENGGTAAIPYIGLYLGDLIFIDEGNPNFIESSSSSGAGEEGKNEEEGEEGAAEGSKGEGAKKKTKPRIVNFSKRQQYSQTVDELLRFQPLVHNFVPISFIQDYLEENVLPLSEDDAYRLSLLVEGRSSTPHASTYSSASSSSSRKRATTFEHENVEGSVFYDRNDEPVLFDPGADDSVAGTLLGFLVNITNENQSDDFGGTRRNAFLHMYKAVTTPRVLLELLAMRYNVPSPKSSLSSNKTEKYSNEYVKSIHQRVAAFLQFWLGKHWDDFSRDPGALAALRFFVRTRMTQPYMAALASMLLSICDAKEDAEAKAAVDENQQHVDNDQDYEEDMKSLMPPSSSAKTTTSGGKDHSVIKLDSSVSKDAELEEEIAADWDSAKVTADVASFVSSDQSTRLLAEELARRHHAAFRRVHAAELLLCEAKGVWNNPTLAMKKAPESLRPLLQEFFTLQRWIQHSILLLEQRDKRAARIAWFIDVAEHCFDIRAHSPAAAIAAALTDGLLAPAKLVETWELVSVDHILRLRTLTRIFSRSADFGAYRNHLHASQTPCVPLLTANTLDMMDIARQWGHMTVNKCERNTVIQFASWLKAAPTVVDVTKFQRTPFDHQREASLVQLVRRCYRAAQRLDDDQLASLGQACVDEERATSHLSPFEREVRSVTMAALERDDVRTLLRPLIAQQIGSTAVSDSLRSAVVSGSAAAIDAAQRAQEERVAATVLAAQRLATRAGTITEQLDKLFSPSSSQSESGGGSDVHEADGLIRRHLPEGSLTREVVEDVDGLVFGWPEEVTLHLFNESSSGIEYVVSLARVLNSSAPLVTALKTLQLHLEKRADSGAGGEVKSLLLTACVSNESLRELASKHDIKLIEIKKE